MLFICFHAAATNIYLLPAMQSFESYTLFSCLLFGRLTLHLNSLANSLSLLASLRYAFHLFSRCLMMLTPAFIKLYRTFTRRRYVVAFVIFIYVD